jgi:asparagine synthase (glutamine-hydrolysing)
MPDLAVYFDPNAPIDAKGIAGLLVKVLSGAGSDYEVARVEDEHIAAVNLLKPFSFCTGQPIRGGEGAWLMLEGALFDAPDGSGLPVQQGDGGMQALIECIFSKDPDRLERLNGQFNAVLYRPSEKQLLIVTDRLGSRPLYHWSGKGRHIVASEMKAIVAASGSDWVLDAPGLFELFAFGHNTGGRTVLEGVTVLPPGSIVTLDARGIATFSYFQYRHRSIEEASSAAEWGDAFAARVNEAVPRYLEGPARKGIFLSGGLDSRIIAGALEGRNEPVTAFTFGYPASRDVRYAARIAEKLEIDHRVLTYPAVYLSKVLQPVVERTECSTPFFHTTSILFHDRIAEEADALLVGFCGDAFSGAHLTPGMFSVTEGPVLEEMLFNRALCCREKDLGRIFQPEALIASWNRLRENFQSTVGSLEGQNGVDIADAWDVENRQRRFTFSAPKVDRGRFEVLAPLCDRRIVDLVLTLPPDARRRQIAYRHAILSGFPRLRNVPWAATGQRIEVNPLKNLAREALRLFLRASGAALGKVGIGSQLGWQYRDLGNEIRRDGDLFDVHLYPALEAGYFTEDLFSSKGIRNLAEEHRAGRTDASHLLGTLLTLSTFMDLCNQWRKASKESF